MSREDEIRFLITKLKSGEYDGADLMQAWIAIDTLRAENEELNNSFLQQVQKSGDLRLQVEAKDKRIAALEGENKRLTDHFAELKRRYPLSPWINTLAEQALKETP